MVGQFDQEIRLINFLSNLKLLRAITYISYQILCKGDHLGSLKLKMMGIYRSQKSSNITNQCFLLHPPKSRLGLNLYHSIKQFGSDSVFYYTYQQCDLGCFLSTMTFSWFIKWDNSKTQFFLSFFFCDYCMRLAM